MTVPFTPDSEPSTAGTPRASGSDNGSIALSAMARFEFEAGKGNEGTKILMIEWEDDDLGRSPSQGRSCHVEWEGKNAVLPADERTSESTRRFYFLLPPNVTIPPVVTLSYETTASTETGSEAETKKNVLQLNSLPAIFPPELGATGRSAGKKGVLHTIWAKKRVQVLDREIREECLNNAEGIALHMAAQEKDWIETYFGVGSKSDVSDGNVHGSNYPMGPTTPVSPGNGGKLGEKLKGLKLQTSEQGLSPKPSNAARHLLSPQSPDIAVSSFNSFHSIHTPNPTPKSDTLRAVYPPESIQAQQHANTSNSGFASMGSMGSLAHTASSDSGEELFAKALSPRSPDLPKSPFSFRPETLI